MVRFFVGGAIICEGPALCSELMHEREAKKANKAHQEIPALNPPNALMVQTEAIPPSVIQRPVYESFRKNSSSFQVSTPMLSGFVVPDSHESTNLSLHSAFHVTPHFLRKEEV